MSAKEGEGLQDLLTVTVGLAERFLEDRPPIRSDLQKEPFSS